MTSLQESPHPLVFKVANREALGWAVPPAEDVHVRVLARSLEGMQKEAIVLYGPTGTLWRMVSDEGPYLNGTDLAPFPLAFFTTGLAANYLSTLVALAMKAGVQLPDPVVIIDSRYSMSGSALKGTMRGDALPVELRVNADESARSDLEPLIREAVGECPAFRMLTSVSVGRFALRVNGETVTPTGVPHWTCANVTDPRGFSRTIPDTDPRVPTDIIEKLRTAPMVSGEGGVGSSLASDQKRILHLRGVATLRPDGLKQIRIELFRPVGSSFQFLSDNSRRFGGHERAPSGLGYMAGGLAFCYMTQLGRYASIVRKPLEDYRLLQDVCFLGSTVSPVSTQVVLDTPEGDEFGRQLVSMGAQTCFLHAACRSEVPIRVLP